MGKKGKKVFGYTKKLMKNYNKKIDKFIQIKNEFSQES